MADLDPMDPCDTSHVSQAFFNATYNFRNMVRDRPFLFNPDALTAINGAIECFPPKIVPGRANSYLRPVSMQRCTNKTGSQDFVAAFYPHVWRKVSAQRPTRLKKCRYLGQMITALNCIGHDFESSLAYIKTHRWKETYQGLIQLIGRPVPRWVANWPNESSLVVLSSGKGRLLFPALQGRRAGKATLVSYAGSSEWLASNSAFRLTTRIARDLNISDKNLTSHCGTGFPKTDAANGFQYFHYPDIWRNDVTIQYPCLFDTKKHWRGPHGRTWLASFVGTETHCSRRDLLEYWMHREGTGIKVMNTPGVPGVYTKTLQTSRFCLVLDGHFPWTIRYLDALQHGCVPVVLSVSWHPPLHRLLDWKSAIDGRGFPTVFVHPSLIRSLDVILGSIDEDLWLQMQEATIFLARVLDARYHGCSYLALDAQLPVLLECARHPGRDLLVHDCENFLFELI
ncbi:unnamed protein product, partial [Symbiodinium sp. CCMP2456]